MQFVVYGKKKRRMLISTQILMTSLVLSSKSQIVNIAFLSNVPNGKTCAATIGRLSCNSPAKKDATDF